MKRILSLGALAAILSLTGCGGAHSLPPSQPATLSGAGRVALDTIGGSPPMRMRLALYDAPLPSGHDDHVNLALLGADAVEAGTATTLVAYSQPQTVDLLTLRQTPFSLVGDIRAGNYDALRLRVDPARSNVVIDGRVYPMAFEGRHERGDAAVLLYARVAIAGTPGDSLDVAVDFNVLDSVAIHGGVAYVKPKLIAAQQAAQVSGRVVGTAGDAVRDATVVAYDHGGRAVNSTLTQPDGSFTLHALPAGDYRITVQNAYVTGSGDGVTAKGATQVIGPSVEVVLPPSGAVDLGTLID